MNNILDEVQQLREILREKRIQFRYMNDHPEQYTEDEIVQIEDEMDQLMDQIHMLEYTAATLAQQPTSSSTPEVSDGEPELEEKYVDELEELLKDNQVYMTPTLGLIIFPNDTESMIPIPLGSKRLTTVAEIEELERRRNRGNPFVERYYVSCKNTECAICMLPLNNGDTLVQLRCKHCYHESCFNAWNKSCPLCRRSGSIVQRGVLGRVQSAPNPSRRRRRHSRRTSS